MRMPSTHDLSTALVLWGSVLLTGAVMHWGLFVSAPPAGPPPAPQGEVEVGPLVMGTSLPLELLTEELLLPFPYEGVLYGGDTEGAEETSFFHLGGPFGEPFGDGFGAPFGSDGGYPNALPPDLEGFGHDAHEEGIEAFGAPLPVGFGGGVAPRGGGRSMLEWPRLSLPLVALAPTASSLASWLPLFSTTDHEERPLQQFTLVEHRPEASLLRVTLPPVFLSALAASPGRPVFGGIDYSDPMGVGLPLLRVYGHEDAPLSPHFRVRDFATHDGAPLARISPRLVQGLERLRQSVGPFLVISGYRHAAYNAAVGGSRVSQHMAGQAADLWSPTRSSVELARAAVAAFGCGVGLGLGRNTVHVDVRGHLSTWTYPGAPLSEAAFDLWVLMLCDRVRAEDLGGLLQVEWTLPDSLSDTDLLNRLRWLSDDDVPADSVTREAAEHLLQRRHSVLAAYARNGLRDRGPGAVLIDLSGGLPPDAAALSLSYLAADTPEADRLGIASLAEWVVSQRHQQTYFVYAIRFPGGRTDVGVMSTSASSAPPPLSSVGSTAVGAGTAPRAASPAARPSAVTGWGIVVNSTLDPREAERDATRYRQALSGMGYEVAIRVSEEDHPRYRVAVGTFASAEAAQQALSAALNGRVPDDAWLLPPGN